MQTRCFNPAFFAGNLYIKMVKLISNMVGKRIGAIIQADSI